MARMQGRFFVMTWDDTKRLPKVFIYFILEQRSLFHFFTDVFIIGFWENIELHRLRSEDNKDKIAFIMQKNITKTI